MSDLDKIIRQKENFIKITGANSEDAVKILMRAFFASSETIPTVQQYVKAERYFEKAMNK